MEVWSKVETIGGYEKPEYQALPEEFRREVDEVTRLSIERAATRALQDAVTPAMRDAQDAGGQRENNLCLPEVINQQYKNTIESIVVEARKYFLIARMELIQLLVARAAAIDGEFPTADAQAVERLLVNHLEKIVLPDITRVFEEIIVNALKHGNTGDPRKKVVVRWRLENTLLTTQVEDEGNGFFLEDVPDPCLLENLAKEHGRGIFLAQNQADITYHNGGRLALIQLDLRKRFQETLSRLEQKAIVNFLE